MTHSTQFLWIGLSLTGCNKDKEPADTGLDEIVAPDDPSDSWCDRVVAGPSAGGELIVELSAAHAGVRYFGAEGTDDDAYRVVDAALIEIMYGDDALTAPDLDSYVAAMQSVCAGTAAEATLGPATVTQYGELAVVTPGTGTVTLPDGTTSVAIDLRELPAVDGAWEALEAAVAPALATDVPRAPRTVRTHEGLRDEYFTSSSVYSTDSATLELTAIAAAGSVDLPIAVLTDADLAPAAAELAGTLRLAGRAMLIGEDVLAAVAESRWAPVGTEGLQYRTMSLLQSDGARWPDTVPADVRAEDPVNAARQLDFEVEGEAGSGAADRSDIEEFSPYGEDRDTTVGRGEARAAPIVAHGALRLFYPYFGTVDDIIDDRLAEVLATLEADPDPSILTVDDALGRLGNALSDGHHFNYTFAQDFSDVLCVPVLWEITDEDGPVAIQSEVEAIAIGDAIEAVNGEDYADWLIEIEATRGGATDGYREDIALRWLWALTYGDYTLQLRAPDGTVREEAFSGQSCDPLYTNEFYQRYPRAAGTLDDFDAPELYYINLDTAVLSGDRAFENALDEAAGSSGLVIDMRGYPGTVNHYSVATAIMPTKFTSAYFRTPTWTGPDDFSITESIYDLEPTSDPSYAGPIAVLIGPHSVSAAENFLMMLGDRVTYVGKQTAGTNGNITSLYLPGDYAMTFTGMEVLFPDGSTLHGIGILPDVEVWPTQADIAAGDDVVLQAAINVLQ
jgi:C-terminal processing protease CtpA/Prc